MMKLHWSPRSPYVRKVMIVAHELGLADRIETVRTVVGGTTPHLELMRENPLGKIPTLVLEDGTIIYDSPVICEYLDTLHDGPKLFPAWPERLTALRRLALGDGMLDIALAWLGERFRPEEKRSEPHMALWQGKIRACVDALEQEADALAASRVRPSATSRSASRCRIWISASAICAGATGIRGWRRGTQRSMRGRRWWPIRRWTIGRRSMRYLRMHVGTVLTRAHEFEQVRLAGIPVCHPLGRAGTDRGTKQAQGEPRILYQFDQ